MQTDFLRIVSHRVVSHRIVQSLTERADRFQNKSQFLAAFESLLQNTRASSSKHKSATFKDFACSLSTRSAWLVTEAALSFSVFVANAAASRGLCSSSLVFSS
jgi:hypothetical protein